MKKVSLVVLALVATMSFAFTGGKVKTLKVDGAKSSFNWLAKKFSGEHNGTVGIQSGTLSVDGATLVGGEFVIDMKSIICADITDKGYNEKLIGHLSGEDFFNVAAFPTATLKITKVVPSAAGQVQITGNLNIKGITNAVTFPANFSADKSGAKATAKFDIDRTKWNIKFGSGLIGTAKDKVIYDDFNVNISLVATK